MNNASHGHGHEEPVLGTVSPAAIQAGHEPDSTFAVKPIMSIPLAVVATFVIAFSVAAASFVYFDVVPKDPHANADAVARSAEGTDERLSHTERAGLRSNPLRDVDQPRLEPLRRLEKDGMFIARPPLPEGNSPEIHPDEIRPDRVPLLHATGYAGPDKKFAHIPIDEAMKLAAADKAMFPVRKDGSKPTASADKPSSASGGVGVEPALPKAPVAAPEAKKK